MKEELISFNDVLIKPKYSNVTSRKDVDLSTVLSSKLKLDIPIIASNMDTVCEEKMATSMSKLGGMGVLHRNLSLGERLQSIRILNINSCLAGVAVGVHEFDTHFLSSFAQGGVNAIVVDVAHGDALHVYNAIIEIKCFLERMMTIKS